MMSVIVVFLGVATTLQGSVAQTPQLVGTVTKQFYWFLPDTKGFNQDDAQALCVKNGMTLASIKTPEEQSIIKSIAVGKTLNGNQGYNFWVSGKPVTNTQGQRDWRWSDNTPVGYNQWSQYWAAEPTTVGNCSYVSSTYWAGGLWFAFPCTAQGPVFPLCEKITTNFYQQGI